MSRHEPLPYARKSSAPWDRLRPVKQDPLEAVGYVSKGDNRLLDVKVQESFYHKIVARYMQFCTRHKRDLDGAFAALSISDGDSTSSDPTKNPLVNHVSSPQPRGQAGSQSLAASKWASTPPEPISVSPADELSTILTALRKLREGLLATSSTAVSPIFSQRVHVFNIRVAILALHPPSYHPSLSYLLRVLHTANHPLPESELKEMVTYTILDLALRQADLVAAYSLRYNSRCQFGYEDRFVDQILRAVVTSNWIAFWRVRRQVDGYVRAMMHWHTETIRKATLRAFGRAYMKVDSKWLLKSVSGGEMSWPELVTKEDVGWSLEGDSVIVRKPKVKT